MDDVFFFCDQQQQSVVGRDVPRRGTSKGIDASELDSSSSEPSKLNTLSDKKMESESNVDSCLLTKCDGNSTSLDYCKEKENSHSAQITKRLNCLPKNLKKTFIKRNIIHRSLKNSFGQDQEKNENDIGHVTIVDIKVEDHRQYTSNKRPLALYADDLNGVNRDMNLKGNCELQEIDKKSVNRDNHCTELENVGGSKRPHNQDHNHDVTSKSNVKSYLWGSKDNKTAKNMDKSIKVQGKSHSVDKQSKNKKTASSPLKILGRSSLSIETDKITINLSKYSPCASRLAASSKILSTDAINVPESPLVVNRSRSPSYIVGNTEDASKPEKPMIQASLSLNIQQLQKTQFTSRSKSVGDSCVTSPTSEATTLSYSPTGTEILSLEEVDPQTSTMNDNSAKVKEELNSDYSEKICRAALETKC